MSLGFIFVLVGSIVAFTLIIVGTVMFFVFWWLRRKKAEITRRWTREEVTFLRGPELANVSGLESRGVWQIRGNGFIALTDRDLRVTRAVPATEWRIPHEQITEVTLQSSFLAKWRPRKVLVITFVEAGRQDRLGVYVRNSAAWVQDIKGQMSKSANSQGR